MADSRPNILFFYPDTLRHDWLQTRGVMPVRTPCAVRLAAEGVEHPGPVASTKHTPDEHNCIRQNFSAMVENIDRLIGTYMNELERRGELANTLVVLSSDHGDISATTTSGGSRSPARARPRRRA